MMQGAKAAAAWGVCILLLTAKANTSPMYKSLAAQFDGKLAFGEARSSNQEIASVFGVDRCSPPPKMYLHHIIHISQSPCMTFETCSGTSGQCVP